MNRPLHHGAIGNGRILALVSPQGSVEWLCLPRFDSPSVFGALLDPERGGSWTLEPADDGYTPTFDYVENTNVLRTTYRRGDDAFEVFDFAPVADSAGPTVQRAAAQVIRVARPIAGTPRVRTRFDPRPEYGHVKPTLLPGPGGIVTAGGPAPLHLHGNVPEPCLAEAHPFALDREISFVLAYGAPEGAWGEGYAAQALTRTVSYWRRWVLHCAISQIAPRSVIRSALALRLHVYDDTGAIIAASTTSIPEARGTGRTWDYRYCWLRDAVFTLRALERLGQIEEAEGFLRFLTDLVFVGDERIQPLYGIGGERQLTERTLEHLSGWDGVGPVRVGNAAFTHEQHDVYGETVALLSRLITDPRILRSEAERTRVFAFISRLVERALAAADQPDSGIWELRSDFRHHTFSKVMIWVAAKRGTRVAERLGHTALAARWRGAAETLRETILARAFDAKTQSFSQAYGSSHADASTYLMPIVGFIHANDPRFLSTLDHYEKVLVRDGLVLRYTNPDDFGKTTSAFLICAFWRVEALALAGRFETASREYEKLLTRANPLGLYSEDVDPATGEMLGNFPQAYTHAGMINASDTLAISPPYDSLEDR